MIKPIEDRIAIRQDEPEAMSGAFVMPESYATAPNRGEVVAVGWGLPDRPMNVKVGDKVTYPKRHGTEIDYKGEKLLIIKQAEIFAIL